MVYRAGWLRWLAAVAGTPVCRVNNRYLSSLSVAWFIICLTTISFISCSNLRLSISSENVIFRYAMKLIQLGIFQKLIDLGCLSMQLILFCGVEWKNKIFKYKKVRYITPSSFSVIFVLFVCCFVRFVLFYFFVRLCCF